MDDFIPESTIRRVGTIKITDVETGESEISATYAAADILHYLSLGYDMNKVIRIIEAEADN